MVYTLICLGLLLIGGINWLSIGFLQYDFVAGLFGSQASIFSRIIYTIIGIAGLFFAFVVIKNNKKLNLQALKPGFKISKQEEQQSSSQSNASSSPKEKKKSSKK